MSEYIDWDFKQSIALKDLYCTEKAVRMSNTTLREYISFIKSNMDKLLLGIEVHSLLKLRDNCHKEVKVEFEGLRFRIDAVCQSDVEDTVIEYKLSLKDVYRQWYIWSLKKYMALWWLYSSKKKKVRGILYGIFDGKRVEIVLTGEELEKEIEDLRRRIEMVKSGVGVKNVGPHCNICIFKGSCLNNRLI